MHETHQAGPPTCGGRFTIQAFLGSGGMGSVYAAYDHQRHSPVALKLMRHASGDWIYRFKNEFRRLAGIVHPNLVTLHDLIQWEDQWLFTMELVPGVTFSQARRSSTPAPTSGSEAEAGLPTIAVPGPPLEVPEPVFADISKVGDALRQLCDGLDYLHRLGIAHGDVKPANALITPNGRVVILDFGISRDWRSEDEDGDSRGVLGTPGYLAPERLESRPATPASDMFAVGVTLFETLTGHQPSPETTPSAALRRARGDGQASDSAVMLREIIESLCLRLLDPAPDSRPTAAEVRDAVAFDAARAGRQTAIRLTRASREEAPFVARAAELETIRNAMLDKRRGAPRVVIISGESGIGKSELMRRILDEELPNSCLVLEGTCYEREQVPYRALDRLIDSLSSKLLTLDADELEALAWADVAAVSRMFPVLRRVPGIDRVCQKLRRPDERDSREQRRAAATTLRQLLTLVAEGRKLILYIDDLHWGDEESGAFLRELLLDGKDLELRLVGCHRQPIEGSGLLSRLLGGDAALGHLEIRIHPLPPGESQELARALLGREADAGHAARVAAEANGNPFLIRELVQFGAGADRGELGSAVARHVELLSEQARAILEVLAVAGRRLEIGLVLDATGIGQTFEAAVILLRSQHLIKASDLRGNEIEPYHDRIREGIVSGLAPATLTARHRDLARALEKRGSPDPALLGFHLEGAGERERAAEFILRAAQNAETSLAPLNAAAHYAKWIELTAESDPRRLAALHGQARNLGAAGRGASAGPLYLQLADRAPPGEALALRRLAAEAWVSAGDFEKARAVLGGVLEAAGIRFPKTLPGILFGIAREQLWIRRRKDRFTPRPENEVAPERLLRIDAYETATELYSSIDLLRSLLSHASQMRESLVVGEPRRVARALLAEVVMGSIGGERASRRGLELLRVVGEAIGPNDFPEERALMHYAAGVHHLLNGRYVDVVETLSELAHAPDLRGKGIQLRTVRSVLGYSRWWLGQWATTAREHQAWILDAVERGDQFSALSFRLEQSGQWASILDDQPERAAEQLSQALASPIARELTFEHIAAKQTRAWLALYEGRPDEAERALRTRREQKAYLRVQRSRIEFAVLHAYAALGRGRAGLAVARSWLRRIDKEGLTWAQPIVRLIDASIAALEGRGDESIARLGVAISLCDQQGFAMFSAAASWRLGELVGGDEGAVRRREAAECIAKQGAKRPDRIVRTLAPGFRDSD